MFWIWEVLTIAGRMAGGLVHPERIEEMERELAEVTEDLHRAVNSEALRLAKSFGKHSLSQSGGSTFSILWGRARPFAYEVQVCRDRL